MSTASRRPGRRLFFRPQPWIVAVLIFTTFGAIFLTPAREAAAAPAWTTTWLNLRTGPGIGYDVILVMEPGAYVEIVQNKQNGYYRVRYDGVSGWAALQFLDRNGGGSGDDGGGDGGGGGGNAVVTTALNLRSSPWGSVITVMPAGASVTVTGSGQSGFLPVDYNGRSGWAHSDYLDTGASGPGPAPDPAPDPAPPSGPAVGNATTTTALNLRAGPSTGTSVLTVMPGGASVEILGDPQSGFYPVRYNGTSGYASGDYLDFGGGDGGGGDGWTEQEIINIIYQAADRYGQPREDMLRVARCESNLNPNTYHPAYGASGLFQFLPGTWATTPYANESIFDPVASANAAGWMWSVGRRGEWVCQ